MYILVNKTNELFNIRVTAAAATAKLVVDV